MERIEIIEAKEGILCFSTAMISEIFSNPCFYNVVETSKSCLRPSLGTEISSVGNLPDGKEFPAIQVM